MAVLLQEGGAILGGKEIRLLNRNESNYPQLMRLCADFNFVVLEVMAKQGDTVNRLFLLSTNDSRQKDSAAITPAFVDLASLEDHVRQNMVDLLHDYLFDFVDEEPDGGQQNLA